MEIKTGTAFEILHELESDDVCTTVIVDNDEEITLEDWFYRHVDACTTGAALETFAHTPARNVPLTYKLSADSAPESETLCVALRRQLARYDNFADLRS